MPHVRLQPVERQDDAVLACQSLTEVDRIGQAQRDQLLVAVQQHRHAALGNLDAALT